MKKEELERTFEHYEGYFRENLNKDFTELRNLIHSNGDRFMTPGGTIVTRYSGIYCLIDYPFILIARGYGRFKFIGLDYLCTDLDTRDSEDMTDFMQFFNRSLEDIEEDLIPTKNPLKKEAMV